MKQSTTLQAFGTTVLRVVKAPCNRFVNFQLKISLPEWHLHAIMIIQKKLWRVLHISSNRCAGKVIDDRECFFLDDIQLESLCDLIRPLTTAQLSYQFFLR